ncbi:hypothetical protein BGZ76_010273 [Entomortierella beljakovae]|nr:hypothetical protein BGZ76_010273 [Entomortierella beljakovae]
MAKIWPADERSLAGIPLSQRTKNKDTLSDISEGDANDSGDGYGNHGLRPSVGQMTSWILLPWTPPQYSSVSSALSQLTQSSSIVPAISSQALVACTQIGSFVGFWRLHPRVYDILGSLQSIMQASYETRPILGNLHDRYRSLSSAGKNSIDGNLVNQFLQLDHELQVLMATLTNRILELNVNFIPTQQIKQYAEQQE